MPYKCVIWGISIQYDMYVNNIFLEIAKNNIEIIAVTSNDKMIRSIDGFSFVTKTDIKNIEFDYVIVACNPIVAKKESIILGISSSKLIDIELFGLPGFDFKEYIALKESNISIISNHCWGGFAYHTLGLKFCSPFVNLYVEEEEYIRLLSRFSYYMEQSLRMYKDGDSFGEPVGQLDDIKINFLHYESFAQAKEIWDRRKERLNYDNLFVEMTIREKPELEKEFEALPFEKKKCFVHFKCAGENSIDLAEFQDIEIRRKYNHRFKEYVHNTSEKNCRVSRPYNLIKLLNGDADFMRKQFTASSSAPSALGCVTGWANT